MQGKAAILMAMTTAKPIITVSLLTLPETYPGSIYSLHEILGCVGRTWHRLTGEPEAAACFFAPRLVSREGVPVVSPAGPAIAVEAPMDAGPAPDIVIVTDLGLPPGCDPRGRWSAEAEWVRACHQAGAIVCSICSGSLFLAEAGLLDGLEATSHWSAAPLFNTAYRKVRFRPERILCPTGPEHRIITGGASSSWCELALYLIARFGGQVEARRMSKVFVIGDTSDGQMPFAAMARPHQHEDGAIEKAQLWVADNYSAPNPVAAMAAVAGLASRTFSRRFRKATGYGPVEYVQALRLEEAKQMLEMTSEATDSVALAVGYSDPAFFRRIFKRQVGITPARYRQRFSDIPAMDRV